MEKWEYIEAELGCATDLNRVQTVHRVAIADKMFPQLAHEIVILPLLAGENRLHPGIDLDISSWIEKSRPFTARYGVTVKGVMARENLSDIYEPVERVSRSSKRL